MSSQSRAELNTKHDIWKSVQGDVLCLLIAFQTHFTI